MKKNRQILLVEDDLYSSKTLKFGLEAKGHKVTLATNGKDALNTVEKYLDNSIEEMTYDNV